MPEATNQTQPVVEREALPVASPLVADARTLSTLGFGSIRHIRRLDSSGRLPKPLKLGKKTVWALDELRNWLAAGAPRREIWERQKH